MQKGATTLTVVHALRGRARLRVPSRQGDESFIMDLARVIAEVSGVRDVTANARTGSLLVQHIGELETILEHVTRMRPLTVAPRAPYSPMLSIRAALEQTDDRIAHETGGAFSLGSVTFVGMLAATVYQAQQGKFLPAGMTLLKYAFEAMERASEREWAPGRRPK